MPDIITRGTKGSLLSYQEGDEQVANVSTSITTNTSLTVAHNRETLICNGSSITITLEAVATLVAALNSTDTGAEKVGYEVIIKNINATDLTIATSGSETIDGSSSDLTLAQYAYVTLGFDPVNSEYINLINSAEGTTSTAAGNLTSTNVQDALEELQSDVDVVNGALFDTTFTGTFNPSDKSANATLSNGNLSVAASSTTGNLESARTDFSKPNDGASKWYWETTVTTVNAGALTEYAGIANATEGLSLILGDSINSAAVRDDGIVRYNGLSLANLGASLVVGDVIRHKLDFNANQYFLALNGGAFSIPINIPVGDIFPIAGGKNTDDKTTINVGASAFSYTIPTGFFAIGGEADEILASRITNVPSGNLSATEVQAALDELQTELDTAANLVSTTPAALTGFINTEVVTPHTAGGFPGAVTGHLVCTSAEHNFSIGDRIPMPLAYEEAGGGSRISWGAYFDATDVTARVNTSLSVIRTDTGAFVALTPASWNVVFILVGTVA